MLIIFFVEFDLTCPSFLYRGDIFKQIKSQVVLRLTKPIM